MNIWPWSRIAALQLSLKATQEHLHTSNEFGETCLAYLDQFEPNVHHMCVNGKLYCMGVDYLNEVTRVTGPRMNWKVGGFDA
jgi:hypothetical protein